MKYIKKFNENNQESEKLDFEERFIDAIDLGFDYKVNTSNSGEQSIEFKTTVNIFSESKVFGVSELLSKSKQLENLSKLINSIAFNCETIELLGYDIKIVTNSNSIKIQESKLKKIAHVTDDNTIIFSNLLLSKFVDDNFDTTFIDMDADESDIYLYCDYIDTYEFDDEAIKKCFISELDDDISNKLNFLLRKDETDSIPFILISLLPEYEGKFKLKII